MTIFKEGMGVILLLILLTVTIFKEGKSVILLLILLTVTICYFADSDNI